MRRVRMGVMAAAILWGLAVSAKAAGGIGEIGVNLDFADGEVHDGQVTLYYAAQPSGEHYLLVDSFGGGLVKKEDASSDALAQWLAEAAEGTGTPRILDADGTAWFTGLPEGLYLLVQNGQIEGVDPFAPIMIQLPYNGEWEVVAIPQYRKVLTQSPETGQRLSPMIGAMGMVLSGMALFFWTERFRRK